PRQRRCGFFVARKRRFCRMVPAAGRRFCGEHGQHEEVKERKRIPCPLDHKHTVYEDQLQKHLKRCNSREKPKPVYFVQDINAGLKDAAETPGKQVPISSLSKEELENLIIKLRKASHGLEQPLKEQILSHQALQDALNDPKNGESASKHLKQQASILGNMEKLHLLGPGRCFVEFGAGRGKLSHWVAAALQNVENVHFLLVERATTRFKVDGKHKMRDSAFERLQVDIQHLCLNKVPSLEKKKLPVVGVGKHLCGAATDLALRCLVESYTACCDGESEESAPKRCRSAETEVAPDTSAAEGSRDDCRPVAGIVIALCCHHKCDWTHYVGREFFTALGLGPVEFHYFQRMSSWATCGMREAPATAPARDEGDEETHDAADEPPGSETESGSAALQGVLSVEERKEIGQLCKRLIDHGRLQYLEQRGYRAALQHYTQPAVSLENVLLTAVP
ncbi:TRM13 enzyme, partial [Urocolius indicus]|nr:TRM13 enzyme [Urocolius indicus]